MIGYIFKDETLARLRGDRRRQGARFLVPVYADAMPVEYPAIYDAKVARRSVFYAAERARASYVLRIKLKPNPYVGRI